MNARLAIREVAGEVQFPVKVVPGASRDRIVGPLGDALKVQVTAPPEHGKANAAVCALFAAALGVAARAVRIAAGASQPRKLVAVQGLTAATTEARLRAASTART